MRVADIVMAAVWTLIIGSGASAATYIVDQRHPQAADTNPGTEALPWKTVTHAAAVAKAGDTVRIKAGRYREGLIAITNKGERIWGEKNFLIDHPLRGYLLNYITLEAYGDGEAVLDGSIELPSENWAPVEGSTNLYVAKVTAHGWPGTGKPHQIVWVFLNDQPLHPKVSKPGITSGEGSLRYKPILELPKEDEALLWYHDIEKGLLYLNMGGKTPAQIGRIEAAVYPMCIYAGHNQYLALRGLTIQRYCSRTIDFTRVHGAIIADCLFRHTGGAITTGRDAVVRRNTVIDDNAIGIAPGSGSLVDENLVIRNFRDMLQSRNGYFATAITYFGQDFIRFRNNVVLESPGNGFWPDCPSNGHVHYGNSVGYCKGNGFYIECPAFMNIVMNNVCFHNGNGIYLRQNSHNTVSENYVIGGGSGVVLGCTENVHFNMRNILIAGNWFRGVRLGIHVGSAPAGRPQNLNISDRNVFDPSVPTVAYWDGKPYKTIEEFRQATGNEPHGRVEKINEQELGLVSFRVAESSRPWERCLMFGNPTVQRNDWGAVTDYPYFWRFGTLEQWDHIRWYTHPGWSVPLGHADPDCGGFVRNSMEGQFLVSATLEDNKALLARQQDPPDETMLEVSSISNRTIWAKGLGVWSVSLPAAGGETVSVRLHAVLRDVKPAAPGGGLVVLAEWSDYTRQRVQRDFLVGVDDQGQEHQPTLIAGTYRYTPIEGRVTAPEWARRFRLFFGLRSCSGVAAFDNIDRIEVDEGAAPAPVAQTAEEEALSRPLLDPKTLDFAVVDLSAVVNRPLRDDKPDDGQGGWTDQGSGADMNNLTPGRKEFQGVPFEILQPNSVVVLRSLKSRPQSQDLPERVTIAVNRRADVLYFLHDCAWTGEDMEHFRYVVRYEDGTQTVIPIVGGVHIWDWSLGLQAKFTKKLEGMRPSIAATLGGGAVFPHVNVYMLEWLNPQPGKAIQEIEFVSANAGVPILFGITVGTKK